MSEQLYKQENLPTSEQITSFARSCILFAHRHGQIKRPDGGVYRIGPMSHYSPPDLVSGQPFGFLYKDTYTISASLQDAQSASRLKVVHGVVAEDMGGNAGALRMIYTFDSSGQGESVKSNRRITQVMKDGGSGGVHRLDELNLDNVHVPTYLAGDIALGDDMRIVTNADFEQLTQDVSERMELVDSEQYAFTETRQNYGTYFGW